MRGHLNVKFDKDMLLPAGTAELVKQRMNNISSLPG